MMLEHYSQTKNLLVSYGQQPLGLFWGQTVGMSRLTATPAARDAIAALRAAHGPLMFVQSAGCCDGSSPVCYPSGEFLVGDRDMLIGEIDGCPFYMDARQYDALNRPSLVLDVEPGAAGDFSLDAGDGLHFVTHDPPLKEGEQP